MSTTHEHTLPNGRPITFTVTDRGTSLLVEYPEGHDLSPWASWEAYPIKSIEAHYGPTSAATGWGEIMGTVYEIWPKG